MERPRTDSSSLIARFLSREEEPVLRCAGRLRFQFPESDLRPTSAETHAEVCKVIIDFYPQRRAEIEALHAYQVWRIDDNGNVFALGEPTSERDARCLVAEYEARGHKQTYWVERVK